MKILRLLITGTCVAALTFLLPISASAQGSKTKASPSPSASPTAAAKSSTKTETTTKATTAASDKPARAIPLRGTATSVDTSAKTFTIAGKTSTRVFKVIDETKITKAGAEAKFADLTEGEYVTGSYWKRDDGTLELKSLKIGGKGDTEKSGSTSKKKSSKKDEAAEDEEAEE
jgi:hypothetical protein